jgi:tetratricopeptide (TPR) repeat protein
MKKILCVLALSLAATMAGAAEFADLGRIEFPNSGKPEAQEPFLRAMLMLHSFEYEDAREAFQKVQEMDPDFALAYWGEAMTHNHPLWRQTDPEAARGALDGYAPSPEARAEKAPTERERGYLQAVELLYGEGDKLQRDLAYSDAMRRLSEQYPEDLEAASFYALSILGTAQGERDPRVYMRAGAVVEEVFDKNPRHPGAVHYLIHSYDDPVHAPLGLRAARVYAEIAPAATHAQHMISHIFVALGWWDEVVDANIKSFQVSEERARRKGLPTWKRNHHALHWLQYAYLQQGRYELARRQMEIIDQDARQGKTKDSRWYFTSMRAAYMLHTGNEWPVPDDIDVTTVGVTGVAANQFATGLAAWREKDVEGVKAALGSLRTHLKKAREAGEDSDAYQGDSPSDFVSARIVAMELKALLRQMEGETGEAVEILQEAATLEAGLPLAFGPPQIVQPSHELLGEMLLESNRAQEAQAQFEAALDRAPRRTLSLLGVARAAAKAGDAKRSQEAYAEVRGIWHDADKDVPQLGEVQGHQANAGSGRTPARRRAGGH